MQTDERASKERLFLQLLADKQEREAENRREAAERASESAEERGRAEERARLEASLAAFLPFAWDIHKPGLPLEWSWHYEYIAEYIELVFQRKLLYLLVNVPPRTLKSFQLSIAFPAWVWAKDQLTSFIRSSADLGLSSKLNADCRDILLSPDYQRLWGHKVQLKRGSNEEGDFANTRGGRMKATAPEARITGHGGDIIILDDILSPKDADSEVKSKSVFDYVDETLLQRRNNLASSPIILIEQRVHDQDMTAHLLGMLPKDQVVHLNIPLVADEETIYKFPISGRIHVRPAGDVLTPHRFPPHAIKAIKPHIYQTQYQGRPAPKAGKIFKRDDFRFYGPKAEGFERQLPASFDEVIQSWDCTFKELSTSDLVAGHVWARKGPDKYLLDRDTGRKSFVDTLKAIVAMRRKWPAARRILIEDKANGTAVINVLTRKIGGILAVEPIGSKVARASAASSDVESGNVFLPGPSFCPWTEELLDYLAKFPTPGINDDDVDAFSQAILKMGQGATGLFGFYEALAERESPDKPSVFDQILATK